ncbi:MAG: hypothetical protein IJV85_00815 [Clostridia bacterium]|nr:hypothetical protein [Clostridia bacterium]
MQQHPQADNRFNLLNTLKLLLSKIKLLILVAVIGGILGGVYAVWKTQDINYYGTRMEFYINPIPKQDSESNTNAPSSEYSMYGAYNVYVMDGMVKMLASDPFAERLMLESNGLPAKGIHTELDEKIASAEAKLSQRDQAQEALNLAISQINTKLVALTNAETTLTETQEFIQENQTFEIPNLERLLSAAKLAVEEAEEAKEAAETAWGLANATLTTLQGELTAAQQPNSGKTPEEIANLQTAAASAAATVAEKEALLHDADVELDKCVTEKNNTQNALDSLKTQIQEKQALLATLEYNVYKAEDAYNTAIKNASFPQSTLKTAEEEFSAAKEEALKLWRTTGAYKSRLSRIKSAVSYSYTDGTSSSNSILNSSNNLARAFIYVKMSVLGDENKAFAEELMEDIKVALPAYVEETIYLPDGYESTRCQLITLSGGIALTNAGYTTNQAIRYAFLLGAAAFAVTCVVLIIIDRSDKRVRDSEMVAAELNVPVLAVIPTIEELTEEQARAEKKSEEARK